MTLILTAAATNLMWMRDHSATTMTIFPLGCSGYELLTGSKPELFSSNRHLEAHQAGLVLVGVVVGFLFTIANPEQRKSRSKGASSRI